MIPFIDLFIYPYIYLFLGVVFTLAYRLCLSLAVDPSPKSALGETCKFVSLGIRCVGCPRESWGRAWSSHAIHHYSPI